MVDDGRTDDGRRTDGRTTEHVYTISSPCEPDGSGELKMVAHLLFPSPTSILVILFARFLEDDDDDFLSNVLEGVSPFPA